MELFSSTYQPPGSTPGALAKIDESQEYKLSLIDYSRGTLLHENDVQAADCKKFLDSDDNVTWVQVQGNPSDTALKELGELFGLHPLHLEDISNDVQRPKLDLIGDQAFLILSLPIETEHEVVVNQVSLFLSKNFVISICKGDFNPFALVVERIEKANGKIRRRKNDYLFYALIDCVIDHAFPVLEKFADKIDAIEDELINDPNESLLKDIHTVRREIILLRRRLWPHRDVLNNILSEIDTALISEETFMYLKSCFENVNSVMDLLETYREMSVGMLDVYISSSSQSINKSMRFLTIITTLFIPPTFIVGVYGMNFNPQAGPLNMPELNSPYGYLSIWGLIMVSFIALTMFFIRRKWFK